MQYLRDQKYGKSKWGELSPEEKTGSYGRDARNPRQNDTRTYIRPHAVPQLVHTFDAAHDSYSFSSCIPH
jgi:hypothetical protein